MSEFSETMKLTMAMFDKYGADEMTKLVKGCSHGFKYDPATKMHLVKVHHMGAIDIPEVDVCTQ